MTTTALSIHPIAPVDHIPRESGIVPPLTFQVAINRTYRGKVAGEGFDWDGYNRAFRPASLTVPQLAAEISAGWAVAPVCRGKRKRANFVSAQHIGLDFDTETDACRLDALAADPFIAQYAAIIHTTASHKPDAPRARVLFVLDQPITDADQLARYIAALLARYTLADSHASDPARLFYGAPGCDLRVLGNVLPVATLEAFADEHERQQPPPRPRERALTPPTDQTKAWAHRWAERRIDKVASTPEGGRNADLYAAAFAFAQLDAAGLLTAADWRDQLISAGRGAGLGERECAATVRSGTTAGQTKPADWVPDFTRQRQVTTHSVPHSRAFPGGPPQTMLRKLRMVHKILPVENHAPCELVLGLWQHIVEAGVLPDDAIMTDADFLRAARQLEPQVSKVVVKRGLEQLRAWGLLEVFSLEALDTKAYREKSAEAAFRFLPWPEQLSAFERHWRLIAREYAWKHAPDDVQPEYGNLDAGQRARLDELRAPVYERWSDARIEAKTTESAHLARLERDITNIATGNYRPVRVPVEALRNVSTYKQALAAQRLEGQREKGLRAGRLAFELGVTLRTVRNMAERNEHLVLQEQTVTLALEDLNDYQRDNLPYLTVGKPSAGMVTLKAEPRVMLRDYAPEAAIAAHDARVQGKADAAAERAQEAATERSQEAPPPVPKIPARERRVTIYANYSDQHKLRQLAWTPGAQDLPDHDAQTGEVYTPDDMWRMMADAPPAPQERAAFEHLITQAALGKGGEVTFAALSEPRERDHATENMETQTTAHATEGQENGRADALAGLAVEYRAPDPGGRDRPGDGRSSDRARPMAGNVQAGESGGTARPEWKRPTVVRNGVKGCILPSGKFWRYIDQGQD